MPDKSKAVVLLSGGLDSSTVLAVAHADHCAPYALSFRYGQRHVHELEAAKRVAQALGVEDHIVVDIDLRKFGGSALTADIEVPKSRQEAEMADGVPITYVPARNTIFLSFGLGWAEVLGAPYIYAGVNAVDYSGYPDCRPEFIRSFEETANLGTKRGTEGDRVSIRTPLIHLTKGEIVRRGLELGVDYSLTHSCYDPDDAGVACGRCDSCLLRLRGFAEAGATDPVPYQSNSVR